MSVLERRENKVTVIAPARLHMGFFDLSGSLGRQFGSVGVGLNEIVTRLTLSEAEALTVTGSCAERAKSCAIKLCQALGVSDHVSIVVEAAIPEHVGLGSGTQMSLAVGAALSAYYDLDLDVREIAYMTGRGARSGIGIGVFEQGGVVVDGGRGEATKTPPLLSRMEMPDDWRFILVFDRRGKGLYGQQELSAFDELPAFPIEQAQRLCHLLLMQGLPALSETDLNGFGDVISQIQQTVGDHFAAAQGGVFTSLDVARAITFMAERGAVAIGQTSWGPTGFCAVENIDMARQLIEELNQSDIDNSNLQIEVVSGRNAPAEVITHQ